MRRLFSPVPRRMFVPSVPIEDVDARRVNIIDPLNLPNGIVYLDAFETFDGQAQGTVIGTLATTEWVNLFSPGIGNAVNAGAVGTRPILAVTSQQSPSGLPLVQYDGSNDVLENGLFPSPWPNASDGYIFYFFGRFTFKTNPPFAQACSIIFEDQATTHNQIGYEGFPAEKPFVITDLPGGFIDTVTTGSWYGGFIVCLDPPNITGTVRAYQFSLSGGLRQMTPPAAVTWDWNEILRDGYILGGLTCFPRVNLGAFIWYRQTVVHDTNTVQGVCNWFAQKYGME